MKACMLAVAALASVQMAIGGGAFASAAEPQLLDLTGDLTVHDPAMIRAGKNYYLFCTGGRRGEGVLPIRTSPDMHAWKQSGYVFKELPTWVNGEIPKARDAWAPDISFFNGKYHLYYALSSFGVNESAIGLATNKTLDAAIPDYQWTDEGLVVRSHTGVDDFNAIDPNLVVESEDRVWLNWGSFWGGIKMRRIDPGTGKLSSADETLYSLAARSRSKAEQTPPTDGAIEAPFIVHRGEYWYLFVSFDFCCRGAKSDYKVMVGRSPKITGPYVDKAGKAMSEGGGSLVVEAATDEWHGAGHEAVWQEESVDYLVFHAYSAHTGRPQLQISTMVWEDGWPRISKMP